MNRGVPQRAREEEGEQLLGMLQSLWDALEVPEYDVDRELFGRLLSGPSKLHKSTVDKVRCPPPSLGTVHHRRQAFLETASWDARSWQFL